MVQIAAVTRQEDAEILMTALKKHGYNAVIHNDAKDNFIHVQIGPFATRDEARAMRTKLLADGYNAILK
jgi:DedD protein